MNLSALQSLYECRHESQEQWTLWTVAMQAAWPEMYRGLSAPKPEEVARLNELYLLATPAPLRAEKGHNAHGRFIDVYGSRAGDDFVASAMTADTARRLFSALHFDLDQNADFMVALWNAWPDIYRALSTPPPAPTESPREPTKWNHGCIVAGMNLDLWLDRCPNCGMPRPSDAASTPPPAIEVSPKLGEAMEAMEVLDELVAIEDLRLQLVQAMRPDTEESIPNLLEIRDDLRRRTPLAWVAARALLAAPIAPDVEQEK